MTVPVYWQVPPRADDERLLGGVAAGAARELGVDPLWIRLGFVLLFALGGWGGLLYLVAWGGLDLARHRGLTARRPPVPKGRSSLRRHLGVALVVAGLAIWATALGGAPFGVLWPLGLVGGGLVIGLGRFDPGPGSRLPS
jgi:phage shock protein PspC (stress-responsive transcriptional regulator)